MTTSIYVFDGALLTAAAATYGTVVPTATKRIIKSMTLFNKTAAPVACTIYLVKSGGTAGDAGSTKIVRTIAVNETYTCPELIGKGINAAGFVQAIGLNVDFDYTAVDITNA